MSKLGSILVEQGAITQQQLDAALLKQGERVGGRPAPRTYDELSSMESCVYRDDRPIFVLDPRGGFQYANRRGADLRAKHASEVEPFLGAIAANLRNRETAFRPRTVSVGKLEYQAVLQPGDGGSVIVRLHGAMCAAREGACHALLKALDASPTDGIYLVREAPEEDGKPSGDRMRLRQYSNSRFLEIWGISPADAATKSDDQLLRMVLDKVVDQDAFLERTADVYANRSNDSACQKTGDIVEVKGEQRGEKRLVARSFVHVPIDEGGGTAHWWMWLFRDISDTRTVRASNQEADDAPNIQEFKRYYEVLEKSSYAHLLIDDDGRVVSINPKFVKLRKIPRNVDLQSATELVDLLLASLREKPGTKAAIDNLAQKLKAADRSPTLFVERPPLEDIEYHGVPESPRFGAFMKSLKGSLGGMMRKPTGRNVHLTVVFVPGDKSAS